MNFGCPAEVFNCPTIGNTCSLTAIQTRRMITIFNRKRNFAILIDDTIPQVIFTPRDYETVSFVKIELKGFNFHQHSMKCEDCKAFLSAFGTNTVDWFINYSGKNERLDLSSFGKDYSQCQSSFQISKYNFGSTLKLNLSTLPKTKQEIEKQLAEEIEQENYEKCCILRDILLEENS